MNNTVKAMFVNGSPRKGWNTAKVLEGAMQGATDPVPQCECGGAFDADALGCCPQCGVVLSNDDVANS